MKKFYAIAAAAMTALSMNAATELYIVGNGEGLGWNADDPMVIELQDGRFTVEINDLVAFQLSTTTGSENDWAGWKEGKVAPATLTRDDLGHPIALEPASENPGNIDVPWKGNYTLVINEDVTEITLTTTTPEPDPYAAKDIYVRGSFAEGWPALPEWKFTQKEGLNYFFVCKDATMIPAGTSFKIADADWGAINYGANGPATIDEESWWNYNDLDTSMTDDFEGTIYITLPAEGEENLLTVLFKSGEFETGAVETIAVANGEAEYFNLQGVRVANPAQGLYIVRQGGVVTKQVIR